MIAESIDELNNAPSREGPPLPHAPNDINVACDEWLTRGPFEREDNDYPFWSHLHHCKAWHGFQHLPNILFVHYEELLKDTDAEMCPISAYRDIPFNGEIWPTLVEAVSFKSMKADAEQDGPWQQPEHLERQQ